ncbi:alpha/beta fold hydrolase [Sandaracinobacteroides saxicola]|uniref:Alpha/beta hydrolase n=1 Tax=Sandaracinobacteroides saxicola TaxID=2759707 RepID=A0A7G5IKD2_9SPHN|nr:alpha/beta hydrolase [Sandaracinobacteroides saxicola]QMW23824.1 alpha/beta hydrolase [Sandaracinobacteroides saxicola]
MTQGLVAVPGGDIFTLRWGDDPALPWLVFAHATGMCAAVYAGLLAPLAARYRVLAFDARAHGRTSVSLVECPDWRVQRDDLVALVRALTDEPVTLAGHSFGGSTAIAAAAAVPGLASRVVAVEPAFIPFDHANAFRAARDGGMPLPNRMADQAERRRARFDSLAAMRAAYAGRGVFAGWPDAALDAYLDGGAVVDADGAHLRCTPLAEATTFRGVTTRLRDDIAALTAPLTLLHATEGSTVTPEDAAVIAATGASVHRFTGETHFVPVERPDLVRPWL